MRRDAGVGVGRPRAVTHPRSTPAACAVWSSRLWSGHDRRAAGVIRSDDSNVGPIGDARAGVPDQQLPSSHRRVEEHSVLELVRDHPIAALIVACEFGLWILLGVGLVARYLVRLRRTSTVILAGIPLLDVILVVATALDLHRGAAPEAIHGLAAVYLGFSVAFGPSIVRWADVRFAHRFAGGPPPVKVPKHGPQRRAHLWREWNRAVTAAAITSATLLVLIWFFAGPEQSGTLSWWIGRVWLIVGIWLVAGPLWDSGRSDDEPGDTGDTGDTGDKQLTHQGRASWS